MMSKVKNYNILLYIATNENKAIVIKIMETIITSLVLTMGYPFSMATCTFLYSIPADGINKTPRTITIVPSVLPPYDRKNLIITIPKAINAVEVRTQAKKVLSFAKWSRVFFNFIICIIYNMLIYINYTFFTIINLYTKNLKNYFIHLIY